MKHPAEMKFSTLRNLFYDAKPSVNPNTVFLIDVSEYFEPPRHEDRLEAWAKMLPI